MERTERTLKSPEGIRKYEFGNTEPWSKIFYLRDAGKSINQISDISISQNIRQYQSRKKIQGPLKHFSDMVVC